MPRRTSACGLPSSDARGGSQQAWLGGEIGRDCSHEVAGLFPDSAPLRPELNPLGEPKNIPQRLDVLLCHRRFPRSPKKIQGRFELALADQCLCLRNLAS